MNKKIIVIVAVVVLLVVGAYVLMWGKGQKGTTKDMTSTAKKESLVESFTGSLKDAVALNVPMKCKYSMNGAEFESLIKGRKFKGNITTPEGTQGNVLMIDTCMYSWEDGQAQGLKICYEQDEKDLWESENSENLADTYACVPANIPDSEFDLPKGVEFLDMNSFMQDIQSQVPSVPMEE